MVSDYWNAFCIWLTTVSNIGMNAWHHLTPMQYGWLLVSIGVFGWVLMKSTGKST